MLSLMRKKQKHDDVIKCFRVTGPLCGEFAGHRRIPLIKASDTGKSFNLRLNKRLRKAVDTPVIWDAIAFIMTSFWWMIRPTLYGMLPLFSLWWSLLRFNKYSNTNANVTIHVEKYAILMNTSIWFFESLEIRWRLRINDAETSFNF